MTDFNVIPIAPPTLGDVLASPSAYAEAMIAAQTLSPFIPVAGPGRVRGARRGVVRKLAAGAVVLAAAGLAAIGWAGGARAATVTPVAEWHACHLAVRVHEHRLEGVTVPRHAYVQAWAAADHADTGLRADVHRYLRTDRGWITVWSDCRPDGWS